MVLDEANINLSHAQKALLKLHFRLGHFNLAWIQSLIRKGILHTDDSNTTSKTALCKCMACQMAKQVRRPTGTTVTKTRQGKDGALKKNIVAVGGRVSTDQFLSEFESSLINNSLASRGNFGHQWAKQGSRLSVWTKTQSAQFVFVKTPT